MASKRKRQAMGAFGPPFTKALPGWLLVPIAVRSVTIGGWRLNVSLTQSGIGDEWHAIAVESRVVDVVATLAEHAHHYIGSGPLWAIHDEAQAYICAWAGRRMVDHEAVTPCACTEIGALEEEPREVEACGAEAPGGGVIPDEVTLRCTEPAGHEGWHDDEDWNATWPKVNFALWLIRGPDPDDGSELIWAKNQEDALLLGHLCPVFADLDPSELLTATPMPTSALQPFYPGIESRPQVLDACGIASPTA